MALTDVELNPGNGGAKIRVDQIGGSDFEVVKQAFGDEGSATMVSATNPLPVVSNEAPNGTSLFSPLNSTSAAYEAARVVKAGPGVLYSMTGFNSNAAPQFIQVHDASAIPADNAIPVVILYVGGTSSFAITYDKLARFFTNGIVVCCSSTGPAKTIGSADCWFDVQYF